MEESFKTIDKYDLAAYLMDFDEGLKNGRFKTDKEIKEFVNEIW